MPQKVPWPTTYFVGIRGRSLEGDILLDYANYAEEYRITNFVGLESPAFQWWSQHPDLLRLLTNNCEVEKCPFWRKTFALCQSYFKDGPRLDGTVIVKNSHITLPRRGNIWSSCVRLLHSQEALPAVQSALNQETPFFFDRSWGRTARAKHTDLFLFGPHLWKLKQEDHAAEPEHLRLLFLEAVDKDRLQFERLANKFSGLAGAKLERPREPIPERVRIFVWRRDGGKCVRCGSNERLEFDHIIPLAEGGSNTERNLQLLCEGCNRQKAATI